VDTPTAADFLELGVQTLVGTANTRITEQAARLPASNINVLMMSSALMAERVSGNVAEVEAGLYLDTAEGSQLDRLAFDSLFPEVQRRAASPAVLTVRFTRPNAVAGRGTLSAGTRLKLGGVGFQLLYATIVDTGALYADGYCRAEVTGPAGNVDSGTLGVMASTVFDTSLVPSALEKGAGGDDAESDPSLRERLRAAPKAARRGTLAAIEYGAKTVEGVAFATAVDVLNGDGTKARAVSLTVADVYGNANAAMLYLVGVALEEYGAGGIPIALSSGVAVFEAIVLVLTYVPGVNTQAAQDAAALRVVAAVNSLPPGQALTPGLAASAALGASSASTGVLSATVIEPAGAVQPTATQSIRTSRALVSFQ
jgi:hypothetical protein